ncbi:MULTISPECIES: hypothetical protein [Butyrivibrio]|uniref:hypothetical protein n=1 Tax=Butyrivibrio TaxID=830 RepID=UPI00040A2405|nr:MULTISPECIES: hypothetical protein [Butyrivibrio]SEQ37025.1 hypothetical protein SAMN02910382_02804 [Butyrivibrio sp. TB]
MRISKKIAAFVAVLVIFILVNKLICFAVEPYMGSSTEMWTYFYENVSSKKVEMVYLGTSQCECAFNPESIDDELGIVSFNMGTNMQSFENTLIAIKEAHENGINEIVFSVDRDMLEQDRSDNFRADASFVSAYTRMQNPVKAFVTSVEFVTSPSFITKPSSINYFFPWVYNRNTNIVLNIKQKLSGVIEDKDGHRLSSGYEPSDEVVDMSLVYTTVEDADNYAWGRELPVLEISDENRKALIEICEYCKNNGIALYPVEVPYPTFISQHTKESYFEVYEELKDLFGKYGYDYYDFNLIDDGYYSWELTDFKDQGHFNTVGAMKFSKMFAAFMKLDKIDKEKLFNIR